MKLNSLRSSNPNLASLVAKQVSLSLRTTKNRLDICWLCGGCLLYVNSQVFVDHFIPLGVNVYPVIDFFFVSRWGTGECWDNTHQSGSGKPQRGAGVATGLEVGAYLMFSQIWPICPSLRDIHASRTDTTGTSPASHSNCLGELDFYLWTRLWVAWLDGGSKKKKWEKLYLL